MSRLAGKVALVTGAGRMGNIGVAVCEAFLREGAAGVVGTDMRDDEASEIARRLADTSAGGRFLGLRHDVTSEDSWRSVVDETVREFGALDVLVNNAGISVHGSVMTTSLEDLRRVMAVNHDALFLGMKLCAPELERSGTRFSGGGSIINNLSMASFMPSDANLGYQVSKSAARMLTLCAAVEFGPKRIRVNSVHPGLTMTPLIEEAVEDYVSQGRWASREAAVDGISQLSLLKASSKPEDTAHAFVYFASEEARFVTGAALYHDGGIGRHY